MRKSPLVGALDEPLEECPTWGGTARTSKLETYNNRLSGLHRRRVGMPLASWELHCVVLVAFAGLKGSGCPRRRRGAGARCCPRGAAGAATAAIAPSLAAQPKPPWNKRRGADAQVCLAQRYTAKCSMRLVIARQMRALPRPKRGQVGRADGGVRTTGPGGFHLRCGARRLSTAGPGAHPELDDPA